MHLKCFQAEFFHTILPSHIVIVIPNRLKKAGAFSGNVHECVEGIARRARDSEWPGACDDGGAASVCLHRRGPHQSAQRAKSDGSIQSASGTTLYNLDK